MAQHLTGSIHDTAKAAATEAATYRPGKSFGEAFAEKKAQFDNLQNALAGAILPRIPGQSAAKFTDMGMGIDFHSTIAPPSPMMPVPHVVMVYDIVAAVFSAVDSFLPETPDLPPPGVIRWATTTLSDIGNLRGSCDC